MEACEIYRLIHEILVFRKPLPQEYLLLCCRRIENIGEIRQAVFDTAPKSGKQVIAASKENVIAGLSLSTGKICKSVMYIDPKAKPYDYLCHPFIQSKLAGASCVA